MRKKGCVVFGLVILGLFFLCIRNLVLRSHISPIGTKSTPNHLQIMTARQADEQQSLHSINTTFGFPADAYPHIDGSLCTKSLDDMVISTALNFGGVLEASSKDSVEYEIKSAPPVQGDKKHLQCYDALTQRNQHHGTHEAYVALLTPKPGPENKALSTDLIFVTRKPTDEERKLAASRGVTLDIRPVADTAVVFLENPKNLVKSLTMEQLRAIYSGKVTNWKSLGGDNQPILLYRRDKDFGNDELMQLLFANTRKMVGSHIMVASTKEGIVNEVARHPGAISVSLLYYEQYIEHKQDESLMKINGSLPTSDTIQSKQYPLIARVYAVTRKDLDPHSPAATVRDWLLTEKGQMGVVLTGGYESESLTSGPWQEVK